VFWDRPVEYALSNLQKRVHAPVRVVLWDGREVAFPAAAFAASGLRLLRLGQRVRLDHGDDGTVVKITLPTLP